MSGSTLLSLPLTSLPPSTSASATATATSSCWLYSSPIVAIPASKRLHSKRLHLRTNPSSGVHSLNLVIPKASSSSSSDVDNTADSPPETTDENVTVDKLPLETKLQERMEQKLKMKLAKKIRLRRKRLVRKRRMRKKGRWPPSKMKKLKNV